MYIMLDKHVYYTFYWTMGKNQSTWSHRTKIIFREIKNKFSTPSEASWIFPPGFSFFGRKRQRHSERITCRRPLQCPQPKSASIQVPSEEEIDKLLTDKDSINTQKATKLSVKCFRDYLRKQDPDNVEFEEFSLECLYCCGCGF
jgi:hypothetical protein